VFVEAIMNETPWKMWNLTTGGVAENAGTQEAMEVLEGLFANTPASWDHPGLLHLYVHLMEMSPFPQRALRAGDRLRDLVPDSGHLIHMPTHIDVLCGHYRDVLVYNQKAIVADRKFLAREGAMNVYALYRTHDYHFAIYGAMFLGQYRAAMEAAQELIDTTPEDLLRIPSPPMADFVEGYLPMKQHVLIRFGKWREIIAQELPRDRELYCSTTAMMLYAQAVAHSALGHIAEAEAAKREFLEAKLRVPESRRVHNNTVRDLLEIAEAMLDGELEYRRGNHEVAFGHLRHSVELDDALPYDEPWGWMQPTRHALGALLLEQGRVAEAEAVYRSDLGLDGKLSRACQHPDNLWSLHGLHECLTRRSETTEAGLIKQRLDLALARSEVPVKASCFCRMKVAA
jgi:tetratricopeptide (TPR) repeat protein